MNKTNSIKSKVVAVGEKSLTVNYVDVQNAVLHIKEKFASSEILNFLNSSDLSAGIYEGGAKIWECSWDLCNFILQSAVSDLVEDKDVLEVGCGAGLPGITALLAGAKSVTFQDFNIEVLECLTKENVRVNGIVPTKCTFIAGDWTNLLHLLGDRKFDVILTSETIYQPNSYDAICSILSNALKPFGSIFLAAKTYYFGVGGSLPTFLEFVEKRQLFTAKEVVSIDKGVSRKIVQLLPITQSIVS